MISRACNEIHEVRRSVVGRRCTIDPGYVRNLGDKTYEYVAILEFDDASGLGTYLKHPLHDELGKLFWELCESTVIVEADLTEARDAQTADFLLKDLS